MKYDTTELLALQYARVLDDCSSFIAHRSFIT